MVTLTVTLLTDTTELVEMYKPLSLYLKPTARINISVILPQLKDPGQTISNWDLMERIKKMVHPIQFASIKVVKSTIEFVRFEAETDNRQLLAKVIKVLDGNSVKVIGFFEKLKMRAAEAKSDFPTRHDWDSFFRDASNMNELRPGERPDTLYMAQVPCKWFRAKDDTESDLPDEKILRKVMESFGELRCIDIPACDPYRKEMSRTGMRTVGFSFSDELTFEAYIQYIEYISFVRAMDALRKMKLVQFDQFGKAYQSQIKVDFDRSKHLSDKNIRRRRLERERLVEIERVRKEEEERQRAEEEKERLLIESVKTGRQRQREEKRRIRRLEKKRAEEERNLERLIKEEERKLLLTQRRLETRRLLSDVLQRVLITQAKNDDTGSNLSDELQEEDEEGELPKERKTDNQSRRRLEKKEKRMRKALLDGRETRLRNKIKLKCKVMKREGRRANKNRNRARKRSRKRSRRKLASSSSSENSSFSENGNQLSVRTWNSDDDDSERIEVIRMRTQHRSDRLPGHQADRKHQRRLEKFDPVEIPSEIAACSESMWKRQYVPALADSCPRAEFDRRRPAPAYSGYQFPDTRPFRMNDKWCGKNDHVSAEREIVDSNQWRFL